MRGLAKELFEAVKSAEESADIVLQDAQRKARDIVKEAETACLEKERALAYEHRQQYQSTLEQKRLQVQAAIENGRAERQARQDAQMEAARKNLAPVAQSIVERVMQNGNR